MDGILQDLDKVVYFIDDILITGVDDAEEVGGGFTTSAEQWSSGQEGKMCFSQ